MRAPRDRRDKPRVVSEGTAIVERGPHGDPAEFAIRDVSASGARLVGAAHLREGELVRATLHLDGTAVTVIAEVVRTDRQRSQVALSFRDVPEGAAEALAATVTQVAERRRAESSGTVIVLHPDVAIRLALERDLARLRRVARSCATPLEATWALEEPARFLAFVISADSLDAARDLVDYAAERHPLMTRVLLFGAQLPSLDHATSSRVAAVLRTPWRIRALARALGIDLNDSSLALLTAADLSDADP